MGKLQEQMKADLLLKPYSPHTTRAYLRCIRDFAKYFMRPPVEMGETEVRQFLLYLTQDRKVSPVETRTLFLSELKITLPASYISLLCIFVSIRRCELGIFPLSISDTPATYLHPRTQ